MKNTNKKGFTLVELLVVIAIVAILATVAIIGYTSFTNKAHESNDRTLVAQLNTAVLRGDGKKYDDPHDAFEAVRAAGFDVAKIKATAQANEILWDNAKGEFFYTADGTRTNNIWMITDDAAKVNGDYSIYYVGTDDIISSTVANLIVYTNNPTIELDIDAENAHVVHEGSAGTVNVLKVGPNSYVENGTVNELNIATTGKVTISGQVASLTVTAGATITLEAGSETAKVIVNNADVTVDVKADAEIGNIASEDAEIAAGLAGKVTGDVADNVVITEKVDAAEIGAFAGGFGTEEFPYLIENVEQLMNISENFDKYNYYKIADGVTTLDMTGVGGIKLLGSFDGNGVKFTNLTIQLFAEVKTNNGSGYVKNFTIENCNIVSTAYYDAPVVDKLIETKDFLIENVNVSGYAEAVIISSFVGQTKAKVLTINNCYSSLTLFSTGSQVSGFIGNSLGSNEMFVVDSIYNGATVSTSNSQYLHAHNNGESTVTLSYTEEFKKTHSNLYSEYSGKSNQSNPYDKFSKLTPETMAVPAVGETITLTKDEGAVRAVATFVVGVNPGNFTGVYAKDEIDFSTVEGDTFTTINVKNYNVVINDGEHATGIVGDTCYIERESSDGTYTCLILTVVQYDSMGAVTSITTVSYK